MRASNLPSRFDCKLIFSRTRRFVDNDELTLVSLVNILFSYFYLTTQSFFNKRAASEYKGLATFLVFWSLTVCVTVTTRLSFLLGDPGDVKLLVCNLDV